MSLRQDKHHHLLNPAGTSSEHRTLDERLEALLAQKMHGISFSAYVDGQKPGDELGRDQIERRMTVLASRFGWLRSLSSPKSMGLRPLSVPGLAKMTIKIGWRWSG